MVLLLHHGLEGEEGVAFEPVVDVEKELAPAAFIGGAADEFGAGRAGLILICIQ
jgi:hypothetical protein